MYQQALQQRYVQVSLGQISATSHAASTAAALSATTTTTAAHRLLFISDQDHLTLDTFGIFNHLCLAHSAGSGGSPDGHDRRQQRARHTRKCLRLPHLVTIVNNYHIKARGCGRQTWLRATVKVAIFLILRVVEEFSRLHTSAHHHRKGV